MLQFIIPQLDSSQGQFTQVDINNLGEQAQEVINMLKSLGVIPNTSEQQQQPKRNIDRVSGLDAYRAANDAAKKAEEEYQNQIKKEQQAQTEIKSDDANNFVKQNLTGISAELMSQTERLIKKLSDVESFNQNDEKEYLLKQNEVNKQIDEIRSSLGKAPEFLDNYRQNLIDQLEQHLVDLKTEREERKARQSDKIQQDIQSVVEIMRSL
jgi:hypothetical protein